MSTEATENQGALAKSEALLAETGRMARVGGWELDVETLAGVWTTPLFDIFELPEGETSPWEDAVDFYHPEDRPIILAAVQEAIDNGVPFDLELRAFTAKGNLVHARTNGKPVFVDGKVVKVSGFLQDITERVENQAALAKSEALLAETGRMARVGGWELDIETSERRWTEPMFEIFELPEAETPPWDVAMNFYHPEDQPRLRAALQEAREQGQPYDLELRATTAKGNPICVRTNGKPVFVDGRIVKLSGFLQDITQRAQQAEVLQAAFIDTIEAMIRAIETRDPYTATHQRNVSRLAAAIAEGLGLPSETIKGVTFGAMIHDIGKISVPSQILNKPGKLSDLEFELVKAHSVVGFEIISEVEYPWPVAEIVLQHHERLDGSGYPNGLRGTEISPLARIVAVADVVEAMSSHRPYRPSLPIEAALDEITQNRGTRYDADVVDVCVRLFREEQFGFEGS